MYVIAVTFRIIIGHTYVIYFSNHHDTGSNTRKVAADISKFPWPYFRFGALHNENNEIKTQRKFPAIIMIFIISQAHTTS